MLHLQRFLKMYVKIHGQSISNLEWRERVEAEAQCDEVLIQLTDNEIECVDLQLLYFYDPK